MTANKIEVSTLSHTKRQGKKQQELNRDKNKLVPVFLLKNDEELNLLRIKLEADKKQKRGLMQKLLTGQRRVKASEEVSP